MSKPIKNENQGNDDKDNLEKQKAILESCRFDPSVTYAPDNIYFTIGGETIGSSGNIVSIIGPPKVGKTTFISAMVASFILGHSVYGLSLHKIKGKNKLVVFDTEQSKYDASRYVDHIRRICKTKNIPGIDFFLLKRYFHAEILSLIESYLKMNPDCGIVIIDGLIDLVASMNDDKEAQHVMRKLMTWGETYNVLFISALHTSKGKDLNSLGHLGGFSDRKSQSVILVEKEKDGSSTFKSKYLRSSAKGFDDINVIYNKQTGIFHCTTIIEKLQKPK